MNRQVAKSAKDTLEPDARTDRAARAVIDSAIEVHRELGPGYVEAVYEEAICLELNARGIPFVRQRVIEVGYKGRKVGESRLDLLVDSCLIVELKAVEALAEIHTAQMLSYLKATNRTLGLLINFNVPLLRQGIKRIVRSST